jgi:hypothetical protein
MGSIKNKKADETLSVDKKEKKEKIDQPDKPDRKQVLTAQLSKLDEKISYHNDQIEILTAKKTLLNNKIRKS